MNFYEVSTYLVTLILSIIKLFVSSHTFTGSNFGGLGIPNNKSGYMIVLRKYVQGGVK